MKTVTLRRCPRCHAEGMRADSVRCSTKGCGGRMMTVAQTKTKRMSWWYDLHPSGDVLDTRWSLDRRVEDARRTLLARHADPQYRDDIAGPRLTARDFNDEDVKNFLKAELRAYRGATSEEDAHERAERSVVVQRAEGRAVKNAFTSTIRRTGSRR